MQTKVLMPSDKESILSLERQTLKDSELEEMEATLIEWKASWREESLDFYLNKGWSYGIFVDDKLAAYVLAQPFLFLEGYMQSLWVEHLFFLKEDLKDHLLEVVYKTAREKHLQKLLFNKKLIDNLNLKDHAYTGEEKGFFSMATTKIDSD